MKASRVLQSLQYCARYSRTDGAARVQAFGGRHRYRFLQGMPDSWKFNSDFVMPEDKLALLASIGGACLDVWRGAAPICFSVKRSDIGAGTSLGLHNCASSRVR